MDWLYEWVKTIVFYYIFVSIITNALPDTKYQSYVKYFLGILLIVIMLGPILNVLHLAETLDAQYIQKMMEIELENIEDELK